MCRGSARRRIHLAEISVSEEGWEKHDIRRSAPEGAFDFERLAVSLKRYPDTKLEVFGTL
jgi:hypothetical protein